MTKIGRHPVFDLIMRRYGYIIFVYGLPFLILLVVNIGIVKKLIETKRRKRDLLSGASLAATAATNPLLMSETATNGPNSGAVLNGKQNSNGGALTMSSESSGHGHANHYARNKSLTTSKKSVSMLRTSLASSIKLDPRITLMVMAIVFAFFLCQFPYLVVNILFSSSHNNTKGFFIAKIG